MLFVGMNVTLFKGMLGFKGTSLTRWHVNIPIPEVEMLRDRYRLKVSAVDVEPNAEDLPITGRLTFFGNCADALTGKEADLLAPLTKGRPNYVPPAIIAAVGKKCTITAEVDQETYDANSGIVFLTVSKAQLLTDSVQVVEPSTHTTSAITDKAIMPIGHHPEGSFSQTTPPKDVLESIDAEEDEDKGKENKDKKRKTIDDKKGPAKALFKGKK
ncbi:hypothetical protein QYE76_017282 [Lolium multiflorum]|uniref:Uncharacterized protein n=1 Tax=Lolium multiflorum TaxID=4521 RepID=A0AAD8Q5I7_LOLMU|nr:hypothetical protein QYE76_017282 [Lolium multiflorum]